MLCRWRCDRFSRCLMRFHLRFIVRCQLNMKIKRFFLYACTGTFYGRL